jgi:hypothetical protein
MTVFVQAMDPDPSDPEFFGQGESEAGNFFGQVDPEKLFRIRDQILNFDMKLC